MGNYHSWRQSVKITEKVRLEFDLSFLNRKKLTTQLTIQHTDRLTDRPNAQRANDYLRSTENSLC